MNNLEKLISLLRVAEERKYFSNVFDLEYKNAYIELLLQSYKIFTKENIFNHLSFVVNNCSCFYLIQDNRYELVLRKSTPGIINDQTINLNLSDLYVSNDLLYKHIYDKLLLSKDDFDSIVSNFLMMII